MALLDKVTCPHCWAVFEPHELLWLAAHNSLRGDPKLGLDAEKRYLPTRFTPDGFGIDELNGRSHRIACPACHLEIPRATTEMASWMVSVIGAPSSGKSFYLGALAYTLRRLLHGRFRVSFTDADPDLNRLISHYEQSMFGHPRPNDLIDPGNLILKTQLTGDLYSQVYVGGEKVLYPRPFLFALRPDAAHPHIAHSTSAARLLCLYDNAGESFLPGGDSSGMPATRHLAQASVLVFLFDPTQDSEFRQAHLEHGAAGLPADDRLKLRQQQTILTEAALRVRLFKNMPADRLHDKPLFVVVTKQDLWGHQVPAVADPQPMLLQAPSGIACLNQSRIRAVSAGIREMLLRYCPGMVDAAESFAQTVVYVGASSFGTAPERDGVGPWKIRPRDIRPVGVEVPILYGLNRLMPGLFPSGDFKTGDGSGNHPAARR